CAEMTRPEALAQMAKLLEGVNAHAGKVIPGIWALADWIRDSFLPFSRRRWKLSTASTTGDRIRKHIVTDLGPLEMASITRDNLQKYLEQKAAQGHSFSLVDHLRWDMSIFSSPVPFVLTLLHTNLSRQFGQFASDEFGLGHGETQLPRNQQFVVIVLPRSPH